LVIMIADTLVKTSFSQCFVIPAKAGDSADFDLVISKASGFPPAWNDGGGDFLRRQHC
jgi:hypothetical protein